MKRPARLGDPGPLWVRSAEAGYQTFTPESLARALALVRRAAKGETER